MSRFVPTVLLCCALGMIPALALDGGTPRVETFAGWRAFEVITQGDDPSGDGFGYAVPGFFDGGGAWLVDPATLRVYVNHETGDASISEIDLDLVALKTAIGNLIASGATGGVSFVLSARQAYDRWSDDGGVSFTETPDTLSTSFERFCSSQLIAAHAFGPGRGFVDSLYITGEERTGGALFALDVVNRELYQLSGVAGSAPGGIGGMPFDSWENAALIDTGETQHVALLLSPDGGTQQMKIYIGHKGRDVNGNVSNGLLARNGLAYGSWYFLNALQPALGNTNNGTFDTGALGALTSFKLEDVDTSPGDPTRVVQGDQDGGVFVYVFDLVFSGAFSAGASRFNLTRIVNQSSGVGILDGADNVDWTAPTTLGGTDYAGGLIYVNEDTINGEIWQLEPDGSNRLRIGATLVGAESTGIFDLSGLVGYAPAGVLVVSNQGDPASMTILVNPDAIADTSEGAGRVGQLRVGRSGASLELEWQPSCSADDDDYAVYTGEPGSFAGHTLEVCSTGGATTASLPLPAGDRYYLVVPLDGLVEGSYGMDSQGAERPAGVATCGVQAIAQECP